MEAVPGPVGAQTSALVGGRSQLGFYVERVQFPANFTHYPHSDPDNRTYTVISGTLYVGLGDTFNQAKLKVLPPGSFWTERANINHFLMTKDEPVFFQITSTGPSGTAFVDPAHDPRKKYETGPPASVLAVAAISPKPRRNAVRERDLVGKLAIKENGSFALIRVSSAVRMALQSAMRGLRSILQIKPFKSVESIGGYTTLRTVSVSERRFHECPTG